MPIDIADLVIYTVNRGDFGHGVTSDNYCNKLQMHELRKINAQSEK